MRRGFHGIESAGECSRLGVVAALTRMRPVWVGSLALGVAGRRLFLSRLLG